jgi:hypothetical protein
VIGAVSSAEIKWNGIPFFKIGPSFAGDELNNVSLRRVGSGILHSLEASYTVHQSFKIRPASAFTSFYMYILLSPAMTAICMPCQRKSLGMREGHSVTSWLLISQRLTAVSVSSLYFATYEMLLQPA